METLKARVQNGRLVMNEPTDLPEGTTLELVPTADWDDLDDEERAALHAALDESERQLEAGVRVSWEEVREKLKAGQ